MQSSSPRRRRPCSLDVDGDGEVGQRTAEVVVPSSVDRLLNDIAFQRKRERQRVAAAGGRRRSRRRLRRLQQQQQRRDDQRPPASVSTDAEATAIDADVDDEAASAYWWTDVFLRYFVFDDDRARVDAVADSDDLLFFVRRVRDKRTRCGNKRAPSSPQRQRRRRVAYDTRAYRKQQQQQKPTTMLPIGDPAILWPHTVCLNAIVHRFRYTLTVAVCERVPRKSSAGVDCSYIDSEELEFDDEQDQQYDLQLLSRHVHTVYASTSGRRMDAAKGPRERQVYPAVCWAVDDYAEAFRTVIVRPGQTVCAELVAAWPGATTVSDQQYVGDHDENFYDRDDNDCDEPFHNRQSSAPIKLQQKQHRAVLFSGAVPYAAVRAAYECKMSLYREAERKRKRRKQQQRKRNGKKSSLGAALSASLTALFTGGKDSATSADFGDCDYYYAGVTSTASERVEYVTVRGCRSGCDEDDDSGGESLLDDENPDKDLDFDNVSIKSSSYNDTKGLAQMAVTLAPVQRAEMATPSCDGTREYQHQNQYYTSEENHGDYNGYDIDGNDLDCGMVDNPAVGYYDNADSYMTPVDLHQQQIELSSSYTATTSEPGDYYDYGWDYETAASSEQQTPQTPSYHYQLQQQQQLERQKRRNGRPRRLSDPCSTSVFDLHDDDEDCVVEPHYQNNQMQYTNNCNTKHFGDSRRKHQHYYRQKLQQKQLNGFGGTIAAVVTPGRAGIVHYPHRAWSESDGLDRCGGFINQQKQQSPFLLPPPVPYYCAAEAAASGFLQYIHKSPESWLARTKNLRKRRRSKSKKRRQRQQNSKTTVTETRHRSSSAGSNGNINSYCTTINTTNNEDNVSENSDGSDTNSEDDDQNSDDQDSDGEFIGALAAAATLGHHSDSEWTYQGAIGDPVADWDRCDSDSNSDIDDGNVFEWTSEIISTDLRRKRPPQNWPTTVAPPRTIMLYNDFNWYGKPQNPTTPIVVNRHQQYQKPQQHNRTIQQNQRRQRPPPPQLQPQPLELPPPPPALSVAFTAVACPWWTVLEDMLLVSSTSDGASSSTKNLAALPLLTFD